MPLSTLVSGILILACSPCQPSHAGLTLTGLISRPIYSGSFFSLLVCFLGIFALSQHDYHISNHNDNNYFPDFKGFYYSELGERNKILTWKIPILDNNIITIAIPTTVTTSNVHRRNLQQVKFSVYFLTHHTTCCN